MKRLSNLFNPDQLKTINDQLKNPKVPNYQKIESIIVLIGKSQERNECLRMAQPPLNLHHSLCDLLRTEKKNMRLIEKILLLLANLATEAENQVVFLKEASLIHETLEIIKIAGKRTKARSEGLQFLGNLATGTKGLVTLFETPNLIKLTIVCIEEERYVLGCCFFFFLCVCLFY